MKKIFTLRQHTPLIHFQYGQTGATLRASEIKPRLDRFITDRLHPGDFGFWKPYLAGSLSVSEAELAHKPIQEADKIREYLTQRENDLRVKFENQHFRALDYRLKIRSGKNNEKQVLYTQDPESKRSLPAFRLYFGNQGDGEEKQGVFYKGDQVLEFSFLNEGLQKIVCENFPLFLERTNFGCRQTKGYGSFYLAGEQPSHPDYYFDLPTDDPDELFEALSDFYNVLRAGINNQGLYVKSALFKYLKEEKGVQWDKKTIKQAYYTQAQHDRESADHAKESDARKEALLFTSSGCTTSFKELLGLSTNETWRPKNDPKTYVLKREHTEPDEELRITRFKSPVLLKPVRIEEEQENKEKKSRFRVYVYLNEIPEEMRNQEFKIKWGSVENLCMTTSSDFSIRDYFAWIYRNKDRLLVWLSEPDQKTRNRYNRIDRMYKQLRTGK